MCPGVDSESRTQSVFVERRSLEVHDIFSLAGDQCRDCFEVLTVGLGCVRRRFANHAVVQKVGEPTG